MSCLYWYVFSHLYADEYWIYTVHRIYFISFTHVYILCCFSLIFFIVIHYIAISTTIDFSPYIHSNVIFLFSELCFFISLNSTRTFCKMLTIAGVGTSLLSSYAFGIWHRKSYIYTHTRARARACVCVFVHMYVL